MASPFEDILAFVRSTVAGLGLTFNATAVPVVTRKVSEVHPDIDPAPRVFVVPGGPESWERFSTEGLVEVGYLVRVAIALPGNKDNSGGLSDALALRNAVMTAFATADPRDPSTPTVWRRKVEPGGVQDLQAFGEGYDLGAVALRFWSLEQGG